MNDMKHLANLKPTHTFLRFTAPLSNCFCRETAVVLVGTDGVSLAERSALASRSTIRAYKEWGFDVIDRGTTIRQIMVV